MDALFKAMIAATVGGGILIASFYFAYLLLLVVVLAVIGGISYLWFNRDKLFDTRDFYD